MKRPCSYAINTRIGQRSVYVPKLLPTMILEVDSVTATELREIERTCLRRWKSAGLFSFNLPVVVVPVELDHDCYLTRVRIIVGDEIADRLKLMKTPPEIRIVPTRDSRHVELRE